MAVYKEPDTNTWKVVYRYRNIQGDNKQTTKRGFKTRREAVAWEHNEMSKRSEKMDMTFDSFADTYMRYCTPRQKPSTIVGKQYLIDEKFRPYFGRLKMCDITPRHVVNWQTEMLNHVDENGKRYAKTYLKTMHNRLSAIFNHAVRYYNLPSNPAQKAGNMGKRKPEKEMKFWTREEYKQFSRRIMDNIMAYYAFEMLYWCGIREGELLALTKADFDFEANTVSINKNYQRFNGQDFITTTKTPKGNRIVKMPRHLRQEMQDYIGGLYGLKKKDRIFNFTRGALRNAMIKGCEKSGVKQIRIHDLRHSHISLLIEMGFTPVAIADRVGHESIDITLNYAHMFPNAQDAMAEKLDKEW